MTRKSIITVIKIILLCIIPILVIVLLFVIRANIGTLMYVTGTSMEPTLKDGDYIVVSRIHDASDIEKGDIVIFTHRSSKGKIEKLVKRVVGVPNTFMDGENDARDMELGDNEYFVMGDNREHSFDSRFFGTIGLEIISYKYVGVKLSQAVMLTIFFLLLAPLVTYCFVLMRRQNKQRKQQGSDEEQNTE